ncbi:MAG TPA: NAD(P)/FAD-dependent oxidoreductase [Longimicrobium sp.]|nr:NAD(P)/FAD-dependent oxidoreductase [Longimicrobium sp.]
MPDGDKYDAVVVGGGPAGLAGAFWLARYRHRVRLFDAQDPRNKMTWAVHGYLGLQDVEPLELRRIARHQAQDAGAELEAAVVERVEGAEDDFTVTLSDGRSVGARRILLATGLKDIVPEIPGFDDFYGSSIWHCPDCDGPSITGRHVAVIGWGKKIAAYCMGMLTWAGDLTVLTDGHPADVEGSALRALERWGIHVREEELARLEGDGGQVRRVHFHHGPPLDVEAVFFNIASGPGSSIAADLGCAADEDGILEVDGDHRTTVAGVYAAGDITPGSRLAIRAAAEGTRAAIGIHRSLIPPERRLR